MKRLTALAAALSLLAALALPAFGATRSIGLRDDYFSPKSVSVSKNTTVKFVWKGRAPHNVTVTSGPAKFRSSTKTSGSYSKRLTRRGTYRIVCTIHGGMKLTLKVR